MYFVFYKFLFFISDFLEIQRKSFYLFLNNKLSEELSKNILTDSTIQFFSKNLKFLKPIQTIEECIITGKTYCCHFYLPISFKINKQRKKKWIFLGTLPLLTRRGHFLVNGTPRIVLNQIVRSAGIYFQRTKGKNIRSFYAEIIANRGPWIRMEIDDKKNLWISFPQSSKINFSTFFYDFYQKYLDHYFFYNETININLNLFSTKLNKNQHKNKKSLFYLIFNKLLKKFQKSPLFLIPLKKKTVKNITFINISQTEIQNQDIINIKSILSSNLNFDLGENGRFHLNKKLGLSLETRTLTPIDFLAIIEILNALTQNSNLQVLDDIDNLKNRKLKPIGELLQNQFTRAFQRLEKIFFQTNIHSERELSGGSAERRFAQMRS